MKTKKNAQAVRVTIEPRPEPPVQVLHVKVEPRPEPTNPRVRIIPAINGAPCPVKWQQCEGCGSWWMEDRKRTTRMHVCPDCSPKMAAQLHRAQGKRERGK